MEQTIAAISSAVGMGGRIIVRVSGSDSFLILASLCAPVPAGGGTVRSQLRVDGMRVGVWVYAFAGPHSYTGDDLVEVHLPGNALLAQKTLERMISLGARQAEAGEFTARAFFNGRIDLTQAEGVAAAVSAGNQAELDASRRLMNGELSRRLRPVMDELAQTLALVEAEIDFSDQDVRFLSASQVHSLVERSLNLLRALLANSGRLARLSHEPRVVFAGRPNAGKSTLLNALAGLQRAVVSPVEGTTRDALSAEVALERGIIWLVDVAGLEDDSPADEIASLMRERARRELAAADVVVRVVEMMDPRPPLALEREADLTVVTKIDLPGQETAGERADGAIRVSAKSGAGLDELRRGLDQCAFGASGGQTELALTSRHVMAIETAALALEAVARPGGSGGRGAQGRAGGDGGSGAAELVAADLRRALDSLGEVLGDISPDDILGRVFSTFCIGK